MENLESNKLIAGFIGYKLTEDGYYLLPLDLPQFRNSNHIEWCSQYEVSFTERYWEISEDALDYNHSWDWLMPVVEKCYQCDYEEGGDLHLMMNDAILTINIEEVYKAVVQFIKWYNKNN
jgi:hypothetical protein